MLIETILPRYQPTATQQLEMRLVANTRELHAAEADLTQSDVAAKTEIRRLLNEREHKRAKFMSLQAENAELKKSLGVCR
jgi:hypothetical protein